MQYISRKNSNSWLLKTLNPILTLELTRLILAVLDIKVSIDLIRIFVHCKPMKIRRYNFLLLLKKLPSKM